MKIKDKDVDKIAEKKELSEKDIDTLTDWVLQIKEEIKNEDFLLKKRGR